MSMILNSSGQSNGLAAGLQTLLDSNSIFGDSGASAKAAEIRADTELKKGALTKLQRSMQLEDQQQAANSDISQLMGNVAAASQTSGPGIGAPEPGMIGPPSLETQADRSAQMQLGAQHAAALNKAGQLAAAGHYTPQETEAMLRGLMEPMSAEQLKLQQTQVATRIGKMGLGGAFGPPDSPQVQQTIAGLAQIALQNPQAALQAAMQKAAPITAEAIKNAERAQNVAKMSKDAEEIAGYTGQPLNPYATSLLHQMATNQGDSPAIRAEWDKYGKFGLVPVQDWKGALVGVPYASAQEFATSQNQARQIAQKAAADLEEARAARERSLAGLADVRAGAGGFAPARGGDNIRLPGQGSTYNLSPAQARVRGITEARQVAGPAWNTMAPAEKQVAIEQATAKYLGAAPANAVDKLTGDRALPFAQGTDNTPKASDSFGAQPAQPTQTYAEWKAKNAPKDSGQDYDLQGAFKAGVVPDAQGHMPDTFKKPNHPTFSVESEHVMDDPTKAGYWEGDKFVKPTSGNLKQRATALRDSMLGRKVPEAEVRKTVAAFLEANQK